MTKPERHYCRHCGSQNVPIRKDDSFRKHTVKRKRGKGPVCQGTGELWYRGQGKPVPNPAGGYFHQNAD